MPELSSTLNKYINEITELSDALHPPADEIKESIAETNKTIQKFFETNTTLDNITEDVIQDALLYFTKMKDEGRDELNATIVILNQKKGGKSKKRRNRKLKYTRKTI